MPLCSQVFMSNDTPLVQPSKKSAALPVLMLFLFLPGRRGTALQEEEEMYSNVQLLERSADVMHISNFCVAQKEDCLIAVGYSRYTKATFDTLSFFHEKGCSIIAITDSVSSPLALMASEVLIAPRDSYFGPVSATALCSCLIAALAQHDASQMLGRMEMQDALAESYGLYL